MSLGEDPGGVGVGVGVGVGDGTATTVAGDNGVGNRGGS